jgi:hypothetical protein
MLPKLEENSKVIHIKKERNGIIEERLKENANDITDIKDMIYLQQQLLQKRVLNVAKKR